MYWLNINLDGWCFLNLFCQACPISCEDHYNCVECVGFKQGPFNDTTCEERCTDFEIFSILYDEGFYQGFQLWKFNLLTKKTTEKWIPFLTT